MIGDMFQFQGSSSRHVIELVDTPGLRGWGPAFHTPNGTWRALQLPLWDQDLMSLFTSIHQEKANCTHQYTPQATGPPFPHPHPAVSSRSTRQTTSRDASPELNHKLVAPLPLIYAQQLRINRKEPDILIYFVTTTTTRTTTTNKEKKNATWTKRWFWEAAQSLPPRAHLNQYHWL